MAEESDLERTEPASERRLQQARERGQVPRSPELSTFAVLIASSAALMMVGSQLAARLEAVMRDAFSLDRTAAFETSQMSQRLFDGVYAALLGLAPLFLVVAIAAVLAPLLVSGWLFSFQALEPDFSKLNPWRGLVRMFSWRGLIDLGKAVLKTLLIGGVAAWVIWSQRTEMVALLGQSLDAALAHLILMLTRTFLIVAGAFAVIVAIDVPYQIWAFRRQLRMTREEVREEAKETEGNPQIKARIRSMQREQARRRMMAEVPRADVIVTNPAHYAVALRYRDDTMRAPRVVAKGSLLLAERIVELGEQSGVPLLRAPPLARALFTHAELGRDIPAPLYNAVAEVLAWVYQLRRSRDSGTQEPPPPIDLNVPPNMDPGETGV
jgi:flagellar biosynthesis protein FlhB